MQTSWILAFVGLAAPLDEGISGSIRAQCVPASTAERDDPSTAPFLRIGSCRQGEGGDVRGVFAGQHPLPAAQRRTLARDREDPGTRAARGGFIYGQLAYNVAY